MPTPEPWSFFADVAGHLQVSEDTVLRWIAKLHLPAHRVVRIWRFKRTKVDVRVRASGGQLLFTSGAEQLGLA
jgi:excisionase family DNA binding protein